MQAIGLVSINGNIVTPDQAKISIFDRSFLFGDSVYEVTKSKNAKLEYVDQHLARLENSANLLDIPFRGLRDKIKNDLLSLNKRLNIPRAYFRIVISRGLSYSCNIGKTDTGPSIVIIAKPLAEYPKEWYSVGVDIMVSKYRRNHHRCLDPNAKSGNYLNNILALNEAKRNGYYDSLMLNLDNKIAECTTSNIWLVKEGELYTPESESGLLKGITRSIILKIAADSNIKVNLRPVTLRQLESADELFLSSSTKEIIPIKSVMTSNLSNFKIGKITKTIMNKYKSFTN
jgi:branched-chain amino acid aminotransferase